jgi:2Fe-2S ferredoxin
VVDPQWSEQLHPPHEEEETMLDSVPAISDTSRLSCQIIYSPALDGLSVRLADGN